MAWLVALEATGDSLFAEDGLVVAVFTLLPLSELDGCD